MPIKYIPNILTLSRFIIAPFFVYFFIKESFNIRLLSLVFFFLGSVSDFLDGFIARKYNLITDFGKIIDPIADKVLILCAFVLLHIYYPLYIPLWMLLIILFRDVFVTIIRVLLKQKNIVMQANLLAKRKTLFQIIAIHFLLILHVYYRDELVVGNYLYLNLIYFIMLFCTIVTMFSGLSYAMFYLKKK